MEQRHVESMKTATTLPGLVFVTILSRLVTRFSEVCECRLATPTPFDNFSVKVTKLELTVVPSAPSQSNACRVCPFHSRLMAIL